MFALTENREECTSSHSSEWPFGDYDVETITPPIEADWATPLMRCIPSALDMAPRSYEKWDFEGTYYRVQERGRAVWRAIPKNRLSGDNEQARFFWRFNSPLLH